MNNTLSPQMKAGQKLRALIEENFSSQEEFAYEYGADLRTISRYINSGINKIDIIQGLADWFGIQFADFFA
ncbi:MAG: helix-turn-helix transcriptional regulator [Clostridia bacterium]|nr:helix-turn-helix transcriptional regulator [Clostridia bacterium]